MNITVAKLRTWRTPDGGGYQGDVKVDGVTALAFHNDGNGGPLQFTIYNRAPYDQVAGIAAGLHPDYDRTSALEVYIGALVDNAETDKRFRRLCKRKTLFRLPDDPPDEWRTITAPFTPAVKAHLVKKYGVVDIYNERTV